MAMSNRIDGSGAGDSELRVIDVDVVDAMGTRD